MCLRRQRRVGINPSDRVEPTKEVGREDLTCFFPLNQTVQLYDDQLLLGRVKPPFCVSGYLLSREAPQVAQCSDDSLHTTQDPKTVSNPRGLPNMHCFSLTFQSTEAHPVATLVTFEPHCQQ